MQLPIYFLVQSLCDILLERRHYLLFNSIISFAAVCTEDSITGSCLEKNSVSIAEKSHLKTCSYELKAMGTLSKASF
jgi:hypothetical protein